MSSLGYFAAWFSAKALKQKDLDCLAIAAESSFHSNSIVNFIFDLFTTIFSTTILY